MPMQPRPWAETSRPWLPSLRLSIADPVLVGIDLAVDERQVATGLVEPGLHRDPVLLEQFQARLQVVLVGPDEVRVAADLPDRHAGRAQALDRVDPGEVILA